MYEHFTEHQKERTGATRMSPKAANHSQPTSKVQGTLQNVMSQLPLLRDWFTPFQPSVFCQIVSVCFER